MGLLDIFSRKREFRMVEAEKPFYYTLDQYREYFSDERASYDDTVSLSFQLASNPVQLRAGTGCLEYHPSVNGSPPMLDFYSTYGRGIRYGWLMDTFEELASQYGWDSPWAFNCFY